MLERLDGDLLAADGDAHFGDAVRQQPLGAGRVDVQTKRDPAYSQGSLFCISLTLP
jgi:hypothetical protein